MANVAEIRKQLERLLAGQLSLDNFEDWFVQYSWNIHQHGDAHAQALAYAVESQLSQCTEDSDELRDSLTHILYRGNDQ